MSKSDQKPIIFVSYFCGIKGMVMAEWADDKLRVLSSINKKVFVITSLYCENNIDGDFKYFRIPSFSWRDFSREISERQKKGFKLSFWQALLFPIVFVFGRIYDFIVKKWIKNDNPARWSWAITSLPLVIYLKFKYKCEKIFCTGGAAGAYLLGSLVSKICDLQLFVEFQDPIIGAEIHRPFQNEKLMIKFENFLIKTSYKTIYVTKNAANSASNRHPDLLLQIHCIYPGSWLFTDLQNKYMLNTNGRLVFLHLGTLYGTRNLDNFFAALDQLILEGLPNADQVEVKNLGSININPSDIYSNRKNFEILEPCSRIDALNRCLKSSVLLLIQHSDNRSVETIPYKTYDYLNLQIPIFGILNNNELKDILIPLGHHVAHAAKISSIKNQLSKIIHNHYSSINLFRPSTPPFIMINQFKSLLEE